MIHFRRFIEKYTEIPEDEWLQINQSFERKEFAKNEMILTEGSICRYFYFLEEGLIRYFKVHDGDDITQFFTTSPYCFTDKDSFRNQVPAKENIQALTKVVVWQTTHQQANDLLTLKSWSTFTRKFVHEVQVHTERLIWEMKTETAETRYKKLLETYPVLIRKIPLKHLSTFLGIAPQSLSRIRKKLF
jgi:CRP-like cAMP-binding protein